MFSEIITNTFKYRDTYVFSGTTKPQTNQILYERIRNTDLDVRSVCIFWNIEHDPYFLYSFLTRLTGPKHDHKWGSWYVSVFANAKYRPYDDLENRLLPCNKYCSRREIDIRIGWPLQGGEWMSIFESRNSGWDLYGRRSDMLVFGLNMIQNNSSKICLDITSTMEII